MTELSKMEQSIFLDIAETGLVHTIQALSKLTRRDWISFNKEFRFDNIDTVLASCPENEGHYFAAELHLSDVPMTFLSVFPQESALNLTHYIMQDLQVKQDFNTLKPLVVAEVSNILSNAFINVVSNTAKMRLLATEPPKVIKNTRRELIKNAMHSSGTQAQQVIINDLRLESNNLSMSGMFCLFFTTDALKRLITQIQASPQWDSNSRGIF